jgi:hypothetical protein
LKCQVREVRCQVLPPAWSRFTFHVLPDT